MDQSSFYDSTSPSPCGRGPDSSFSLCSSSIMLSNRYARLIYDSTNQQFSIVFMIITPLSPLPFLGQPITYGYRLFLLQPFSFFFPLRKDLLVAPPSSSPFSPLSPPTQHTTHQKEWKRETHLAGLWLGKHKEVGMQGVLVVFEIEI